MRQVGVLAAAGIISLETMTKRLNEDHARAKKLAEGLSQVPGIVVDKGSPFTNMVYMNLSVEVQLDSAHIVEQMKKLGILLDADNSRRFRLVTHYWVDDQGVEKTVQAFRTVLG